MANKIFKKSFASDFTGIDGETSVLEPDEVTGYNRAVNYERAVSNSLRGRVGCQYSGRSFFGIFPYSYTRTQDQYDIKYQVAAGAYPNQTANLSTTKTSADGASITKLIGINQQLWALDTFTYTLIYVSGTYPFTWYSYVSGSNINFQIKANGVSILDTSLGDGISTYTDTWSLLNTIDALAQLSISRTTRGTCPPFAIVNGNQTTAGAGSVTYGTQYTVTVLNTPHNFSAGDIITFPDTALLAANGFATLAGGFVTATTATTITYVGPQMTLTNGMILGYMGQPATNFPIDVAASASSGNLSLTIPYWRLIPEGDKDFGHLFDSASTTWATKTATSFYMPPVATSAQGNLYVAASGRQVDGSSGFANNLIKCDATQVSRTGLPAGPSILGALGVGALNGVYKYKAFFRRYDAQGNIWDGPPGPTMRITTTGVENVGLAFVSTNRYSDARGFQVRSAYKHTAESTNGFFYVDDSTAGVGNVGFIQPGDPLLFLNNVALYGGTLTGVGGSMQRSVVTDYCAPAATISPTISSIKVALAGITIPADSMVSTGLSLVVLRTASNGNQFYVLAEYPVNGYAAPTAITDNVPDASLTSQAQYTEVVLGKEHDAPPPCSLVCQHQGGLVVARGILTPNTVGFSTADGIEYFPTASNTLDVPSSQADFITAIASDTADRLAVFKDRAYYDIVGDLDGGVISINVVTEGDYGIASQSSLVRVTDSLIGVSRLGLVVVQNGAINQNIFARLNSRIINQSGYNFRQSVAFNDAYNRTYVCVIPASSGAPVSFSVDYSRIRSQLSAGLSGYEADALNIKTFERSYATQTDQGAGGALIGDVVYHLSRVSPYGVFRRLPRFDGNSPANGDGDSFIDNTSAISYILETNPFNIGEPGLLKTPIRARLWSVPNDYIADGWVPFSVLLETGASPLATYVGSPSPNATSTTLTFSAETDVNKDAKLVNCKSHFYIVRLTTSTIRTAPFLTGFELMYSESYEKEDFQP